MIPNMLASGEKLVAYRYEGYWKDVGTVESFWEANMDLLSEDNEVKLFDSQWKLYTETASRPAQYIGPEARIENSIISEGSIIMGEVVNSIIFPGVTVGPNTRIVNSIVMEDCVIGENVLINKSILLERVCVREYNVIGNGTDIAVIESGKILLSQGVLA